jgi:flagellar biogenesis protein FliO
VNQRKRIIGGLCIALVLAGSLVGLASRSANRQEPIATEPLEKLTFLDDPNLAGATELNLSNKELLTKTVLSVALVLVLGVLALYVSKTVLPKVTKSPSKEIHVLETAYLGPRKALHLVEVNGQRLLVGSTNENITTLTHVVDHWADLSREETDSGVRV